MKLITTVLNAAENFEGATNTLNSAPQKTKLPVTDKATLAAAHLYLKRKARISHPDGDFDNAKRWYPSETERCWQCAFIRNPSASWPYSILLHCRSAEHIATLHNVDVKELRRIARLIKSGVAVKAFDDAVAEIEQKASCISASESAVI